MKRIYIVNNTAVTVLETSRQKDILNALDELLENSKQYGHEYAFEEHNFHIEYTDGSEFRVSENNIEGNYRKKNITRILWTNPEDVQAYGPYTINEYGYIA